MNDYLNHKWRNFLTEVHKPERKRLHEDKSSPKAQPVEATEETKTIAYPKFRITDEFGEPGTKGREDAEMFFRQVTRSAGSKSTMKSKIMAINQFLNPNISDEAIAKMPIERVLGTLVTLDIFSAIVHKFDPSGGGFLFEGFMAALFGHKGKQIKCHEPGCGIEDIWDFAGERVSLKLLVGGSLDGSIEDLRSTIKDNKGKPIKYIFAKKVSAGGKKRRQRGDKKEFSSIEFYQFTVGTDGREWNWQTNKDKSTNTYSWLPKMRPTPKADIIADLRAAPKSPPRGWETEEGPGGEDYQHVGTRWSKEKRAYVGQTDLSQKNLQVIREPVTDRGTYWLNKTKNVDPKRPGTWIKRKLRGDERTKVKANLSWAGSSPPRFEIPSSDIVKKANVGSPYFIGAIKFGSDEFLKGVAQKYASRLEGGISEIYNSLEVLTDSINHYLMAGKDAMSAEKAVNASKDLVTNTNCVVVERECEFKKTER
jgi:hypothetical protein